ncbi:MAG: 16S rRNA (uracil(1498)-N(3))-methyltransferase [Prevotella sp.]|nr:16S rRNA (uracil(1498)-N(3))-methyltransferase [Candidatus Prevotella equi]
MKEERFFYVPTATVESQLPQDEAVHATRVLRLQAGDNIFLMDGEGTFYKAEVTMASNKRCSYTIIEQMPQLRPWKGRLHLAMAPTKMMDRVEWMAEKVTEVGLDELSFLECQFSERRQIRTDRIEKIVVAAMKQSRKAWKPKVNELCSFKTFVQQPRKGRKFICHCYDEVERIDLFEVLQSKHSDEEITILIGPEGDFSIEEVRFAMENGFQSVSLGTSRLRTETACIDAVIISQLNLR